VLKQVIAEYVEAIFDTDRDRALKVVHDAEMRGISSEDIVFRVVLPAMDLMVKSISENQDANLAQHFSAVGTGGAVYYCGTARLNKVIGIVIERTSIGVYYLSPLDDIAEGKCIIAGRALTCGVINDIRLIDWSAFASERLAPQIFRQRRRKRARWSICRFGGWTPHLNASNRWCRRWS
jgi:hypothetical protein